MLSNKLSARAIELLLLRSAARNFTMRTTFGSHKFQCELFYISPTNMQTFSTLNSDEMVEKHHVYFSNVIHTYTNEITLQLFD